MKKIIFQVIKVKGEKLFQVSTKKRTLFLNKILSVWFEEYYRGTKCQIIRNNESYDDGQVNYYGTPGTIDYFFGFKLIANKQMIKEIPAEILELGDVVEIGNTIKQNRHGYTGAGNFIDKALHFQKVNQSPKEVLIANDGKLIGAKFIDALVFSSSGVSWEDRMKTVYIIRL